MDKHFVKALWTFLSMTNALQATYNTFHSTMINHYSEDPFLSFWQMKQCIEQLSGVVSVFSDMCPDTCVGFTGPLADYKHCPMCGKDYHQSGT
jgi:hypothetical protein